MSYMHYWGRPSELSRDCFRLLAGECRKLRQGLGVPWLGFFGGVRIGGVMGSGNPSFTDDTICFNGRPGHETFVLHRVFHKPQQESGLHGLHWDFVGTDRKPYDALVVATLLSFKHHFPESALNSDGGEADWAQGMALYQRVTGRRPPSFRDLAMPVQRA